MIGLCAALALACLLLVLVIRQLRVALADTYRVQEDPASFGLVARAMLRQLQVHPDPAAARHMRDAAQAVLAELDRMRALTGRASGRVIAFARR